jgi:flagellar biosynthesis protein FlhF
MSQGLGGQGADAMRFVTERLGEIVSYIQTSQSGGGMPAPVFDHLRQFTHQLQAAGIANDYAAELIEETKSRLRLNQLDKQVILAQLGQVLAQNINCIDPLKGFEGEKNVLAFIGPTGVGKTTTIAKIAAHAHLTHEMPVTLISTDTFRMAAVEQLSRYAEILDCPTSAARNPEELWELVEKASTPLVLVDSTGRNPKTPGQLKLLSKLFGEGWSGRTVLTVAANTREQDLKPIVEGFAPLKYDMVSITKLDETYALGTIYNVSKYTKCPVAWTTNGQRVPEDIELANSEAIAVKIIMEAISHKV